ncbi:MAG: hypothetical protein GHCLOJNM_03779 [bacterium]|nr:hypothetical protein [bacterium]
MTAILRAVPLLAISLILALETPAQVKDATEGLQITVYNSDLAVVKDRRKMAVPTGVGELKFTDVATRIDPTSVHFESLSDPEGTTVLEQNYEYDLVNPTKLLDKYLDQRVRLYVQEGEVHEGMLLSQAEGRVILKDDSGQIQVVSGGENLLRVELPNLPEGLITRPTLVWQTWSKTGGEQLAQVTYMTGGINWKADYVMVVAPDEKTVDLTGWVTLDNQSGATYRDARLKLIAGDVNRVQPPQEVYGKRAMVPEAAMLAADAPGGFEEKAFFEYHLYTLQRPTTIKNAQTKQVELLAAQDAPAKKIYLYDGQKSGKKVEVKMEFRNSKENRMGMPLPKGTVRAFKADTDGSLEFVGEDQIDHTPKDEDLRILLGNAFDIVGERTQLEAREVSRAVREETWQIKLRNHKEAAVLVTVVEHRWGDWKVIRSSQESRKKDAQTLEFDVEVAPDQEQVVTFTVQTRFF